MSEWDRETIANELNVLERHVRTLLMLAEASGDAVAAIRRVGRMIPGIPLYEDLVQEQVYVVQEKLKQITDALPV